MTAHEPGKRAPRAAWHVHYYEDGSIAGYEWALDDDGVPQPSRVLEQMGLPPGTPLPGHEPERGAPG